MSTPDRSRVIRLAEAQADIPGPAGERAVMVLRRGPLDIALSLPLRPSQQTPHAQDEIYFIIRGRGVLIHESDGTGSSQATSCSWLPGLSTNSRTLPTIWPCGAYFTAPVVARFQYKAWRWPRTPK